MQNTPAMGPPGTKQPARPTTTAKVVAPYPEQVPTLLNQLTDKSIPTDNAMIVDEPVSFAAESNIRPLTLVMSNIADLHYYSI